MTNRLIDLVRERAATAPHRAALSIWADGSWRELSYGALYDEVQRLGSNLIEAGAASGARVAVLSEPRPEWAIAFFAIAFAGAVVVPLDPRADPEELRHVIEHSGAQTIIVSPPLRSRAPAGMTIVTLGDPSSASRQHDCRELIDDIAVIAYTSGTSGAPKGVMISATSLLYDAEAVASIHRLRGDDVFLSVLPLNHLFELTCGLIAVLHAGGEVIYARTLLPADLVEKMQSKRVTTLLAVPAMFRTLKKAIEGAYPGKFRHRAARLIRIRALRRLLFHQLHKLAGGHVRRLISGGSSLDEETLAFFDRVGARLYQGYGMTEASPVISVNGPGANRAGSVGRPLPRTEVRISDDGEILVRGPQVMRGYYRSPELTREVLLDDGWLHTGDTGRIEDGFLHVTGRIKDLIVLADGRKVHPEDVEAILSRAAAAKELCVVPAPSDRGEEICVVAVPAANVARDDLERELRELSLQLRDYKRPRHVLIRNDDLPKTRTMKIKRKEVEHWVAAQLRAHELVGRQR